MNEHKAVNQHQEGKTMRSVIQSFIAWATTPDFDNPDLNQSAFYLQVITIIVLPVAMIIGVVYALSGRWDYVGLVIGNISAYSFVLWLIHRKHLKLAINLFLLFTLFFQTLGLLSAGGIHSTSAMLYPVILIFASLLLESKSFVLYSLLCMLSVGIIIYAEYQRIIPPYIPDGPDFPTFATFSLMIFGAALVIRFVTQSLQDNLRKTRQAEMALQQSENQLRLVADHIPGYVAYVDTEQRYLFANQRYADSFGLPLEQVIGRKVADVVGKAYYQTVRGNIEAALSGQTVSFDAPIHLPNGGERWIAVSYLPDTDEGGKVKGLFVYVLDFTERKQIEEALKHSIADLDAINQVSQTLVSEIDLIPLIQAVGEQIRAMLAVSVVYISLLDPQTNLLHFYFQYENEQPVQDPPIPFGVGMTSRVMELRHPVLINTDWERTAAEYNVHYGDGVPAKASLTVPLVVKEHAIGVISLQDMERENVFTDAHLRQLTTIAANLAIAIDHARLYTALQNELAERRQAEETVRNLNAELEQRVTERTAALELANRELESLSYTIGHDLRSPIRAISAYSQLLFDDLAGCLAAPQDQKLRQIHQVSVHMGNMVDDFLAFLRLSRSTPHRQLVNVGPLVEQVIDETRAKAAAQNVQFTVRPMPTCMADEHLLRNVYFHLISNALKFTAKCSAPLIEIGALKSENETCYFVRDNGVGFDMQYADKLFGVFQRLHHPDEFEGTGMGLAIVQRIIHRHGGRVWVDARPGEGATFYFTLEK
jgi:PAS domain S-box-containing protein